MKLDAWWIRTHFTTFLLIVLCAIKLNTRKKTKNAEQPFFWLTLTCCFLLILEDIAESYAAMNPDLRFWRILMSVLGYCLRPMAAVGLLLVVCPPERRTWRIWIPCMINIAVNLTAFFSPLAFSFNENYEFVRGPLGFVVFVVSFLYMIQILVLTWRRFYEGKSAEKWILICCVLGCMAASVIDATFGGCHINEAMMIASVFLLFFLRTHDSNMDALTSLRNRFAFYEDCTDFGKDVSAVASIDMNGLKKINDTAGHAAGDRALSEIGKCLNEFNGRNTVPYRVGGDEFVILFLHQDEETVAEKVRRLSEEVGKAGYSISVGYAMKTDDKTVDDILHESDQNMYKAKAEYYQHSGRDRRVHAGR